MLKFCCRKLISSSMPRQGSLINWTRAISRRISSMASKHLSPSPASKRSSPASSRRRFRRLLRRSARWVAACLADLPDHQVHSHPAAADRHPAVHNQLTAAMTRAVAVRLAGLAESSRLFCDSPGPSCLLRWAAVPTVAEPTQQRKPTTTFKLALGTCS